MDALLLATLGAGFAGSLHCVAMCGPLVWISASKRPARFAVYQFGRLAGYATLGAIAGTLGNAVNAGAWTVGIQRGALWFAIGLLALVVLSKAVRLDLGRALLAPLERMLAPLRGVFAALSPTARALGFGALSALLPCGFLWAFVVVAAGTGSALGATAVMVAFFAGTLPALVVAATCAGALKTRLDQRVPRVAVAVLAIVSLWGVLRRSEALDATAHATVDPAQDVAAAKPVCCDDD